jgi:peptide/nickel transport system permease protein
LRGGYIASRTTQTILTLFAVLIITWLLFRLIPGDPAAIYVSGHLTPEDIKALRRLWGLDAPLYMQFFRYIINFFNGNFGISFYYREPVMTVLIPRLINTLILMGPPIIMATILGTVLGSYLGWERGTIREGLGVILSLFSRSFPIYITGIIGLMLFSHYLGWFPLGGMRTIGRIPSSWVGKFLDSTHHLMLPLAVALLYYIGDVIMIARTSILEITGEEYIEFARAKGLSNSRIRRIAMRNAIIPIVTYSTILIGFALGGQVLLEMVFAWPGIGRLMVESVTRRDYPVSQAAFFIMAVGVIVGNLIVDLLYGYLDPRISYEKNI